MATVAVVDYGMGNLRSVAKAIEHVAPEFRVVVTSSPETVLAADRVVVPGQGAMPDCMRELDARALRASVIAAAASKPFLGICIGLQMLFDHSEEGDTPGLGILPGAVRRFPIAATVERGLKVPHMGWNQVSFSGEHPLWQGIDAGSRFYFVHSYYADPGRPELVVGTTEYGIPFTSAAARANIFAVQFHPEKSAQTGLRFLSNFMRWQP